MKIKSRFIFLLLFSIFLNSGCKKNPFDYRTKYLGDYEFVDSWSSWSMVGPSNSSGVNYSTGKVEYGNDKTIRITLNSNNPTYFHEFDIDRDGNLSLQSGGGSIGKFQSRKKVSFSLTSGGLGGGGTDNITGTKK